MSQPTQPPGFIRKASTVSAAWHTYQLGERVVTLCVVRATQAPVAKGQISQAKKGYDVYVGGNWSTGQFGTYQFTVPNVPTEQQLTLWAQHYAG